MNEATHSAKAPILIVGGGIGDCAAAIMLSKVGYTVSLLEQADELIGKEATVKYFNLTPDGVPRFPYVIAIRDYE